MVTEKMLIKKSHKNFINFSFHISTVLGNEANNLSLLSFTLEWAWNICRFIIKFTVFESNVAIKSCFIEVVFIARVLKNSITNHWWNLINYWWRVVEMFIYIQQFIIWFSVDFRSKYTSKKIVPIKVCSN